MTNSLRYQRVTSSEFVFVENTNLYRDASSITYKLFSILISSMSFQKFTRTDN